MLGLAKRTGAKIFQASTPSKFMVIQRKPQTRSIEGSVNPTDGGPVMTREKGALKLYFLITPPAFTAETRSLAFLLYEFEYTSK